MRDVAPPAAVDAMTPSHISALLGWDVQQGVRVVPLTDEDIAAGTQPTRRGTGERKLRQVW